LQPVVAELARPVGKGEGHDHQLPALDGLHIAADGLDEADRLMTHRLAGLAGLHRGVGPQIAAADARSRDAHHRVGGLDQLGVRDGFDPHVPGAVHDGCAHWNFLSVSLVKSMMRADLHEGKY
jgi:hypothetical protein